MTDSGTTAYEDSLIRCDRSGLTIRRYYPWGAKRIPYSSIKSIQRLPLTGLNKVRRWRLWGSGDFLHWWNLDTRRPDKRLALVINTGHHIRPTITPDDPDAVQEILTRRITRN